MPAKIKKSSTKTPTRKKTPFKIVQNSSFTFKNNKYVSAFVLIMALIGTITVLKLNEHSQDTRQRASENTNPVGEYESIWCNSEGNRTSGWACDPSDYQKTLQIEFFDGPRENGVFLGRTGEEGIPSANILREEDVAEQCGDYSNHGFSFDPRLLENPKNNVTLFDGKVHTIYAYGVNIESGSDTLLGIRQFDTSGCSGVNNN